jgi:uncharacterized protein
MKKVFLSLAMWAIWCFASFSSHALEPMDIPPLADFVVDYAGVLSSGDIQSLSQQAAALQQSTTAQVATLIIPSRWDYQLVDIGLKVFRDTWLGQKASNNGILLLISAADKKMRIVVGYGLEWSIPDIAASNIIESNVRPRINSGDYVWGISAYMSAVSQHLETNQQPAVPLQNKISRLDIGFFILRFFIFFTLSQYIYKKNAKNKIINNKTYPVYDSVIKYARSRGLRLQPKWLYGLLLAGAILCTWILAVTWYGGNLGSLLGIFAGNFLGGLAFGSPGSMWPWSYWWGGWWRWGWSRWWGWWFSGWFSGWGWSSGGGGAGD